jgi:hypothetical protein
MSWLFEYAFWQRGHNIFQSNISLENQQSTLHRYVPKSLLPSTKKRRFAGGLYGAHSSQINFSDRPQRWHRKLIKSGSVSLISCPASIMTVPQPAHAGSSPVSKG